MHMNKKPHLLRGSPAQIKGADDVFLVSAGIWQVVSCSALHAQPVSQTQLGTDVSKEATALTMLSENPVSRASPATHRNDIYFMVSALVTAQRYPACCNQVQSAQHRPQSAPRPAAPEPVLFSALQLHASPRTRPAPGPPLRSGREHSLSHPATGHSLLLTRTLIPELQLSPQPHLHTPTFLLPVAPRSPWQGGSSVRWGCTKASSVTLTAVVSQEHLVFWQPRTSPSVQTVTAKSSLSAFRNSQENIMVESKRDSAMDCNSTPKEMRITYLCSSRDPHIFSHLLRIQENQNQGRPAPAAALAPCLRTPGSQGPTPRPASHRQRGWVTQRTQTWQAPAEELC